MPALARAQTNPYGHAHRKTRTALIKKALGTMCPVRYSPRCTGLMVNPRLMHLDHTTPVALGGTTGDRIICAPCNLSLGTTLGNHLRRHHTNHPRPRPRHTRAW